MSRLGVCAGCESGAVFVADTESLYQVDERGMHWSAGSRYKASEPFDVSQIKEKSGGLRI
jgi:hypothetical protein